MMQLIIRIGITFCNLIYAFHKLSPVKNRVAAISRQHDEPSLDMKMLMDEINRMDPSVDTVMMYRTVPPGILGKIKYILHMIGPEMHTLATSRVVVLEGYSITASILKHRDELKIIQAWHALGILKKFAFLAVGTDEGRDPKLAKAMHMHENYDYVLASSEFCKPFYAEAFGYTEDHVKVIPLPRTDLFDNPEYTSEMRTRIVSDYPELASGAKNLLYAPTFRVGKDVSSEINRLIDAVDYDRYNLIVKLHPIDKAVIESDKVHTCDEYTTLELFSVADAVISDYSSIIFEAAAAGLPVHLYTYDLEEYIDNRGFCIDFMNDVPLEKHTDVTALMSAIDGDTSMMDADEHVSQGGNDASVTDADKRSGYLDEMKAFADKFIEPGEDNTKKFAEFVLSLMR